MARNYKQGKFIPKNPQKYVGDVSKIYFRSSWENKFMNFCDKNPSILQWGSEEIIIPYISPVDNRPHRYFTDFFIIYKNTSGNIIKTLIEIKPKAQTIPPKAPKRQTQRYVEEVITYAINQAKWKAATEFAKKHNITFQVLTEDHLGV